MASPEPGKAPLIHYSVISATPICPAKAPVRTSNRWTIVNCPDCVAEGARYDEDARARQRTLDARAKRGG